MLLVLSVSFAIPSTIMSSSRKSPFDFKSISIRKQLRGILSFFVIIGIVACYYAFLDYVYLIDEVFEGDTLREFTIDEKLTIQVASSKSSLLQLKWFVSHYTECPSVHEIIIIWNDSSSATRGRPLPSDFVYKHTHSKVTIIASGAPTESLGIYTNLEHSKSTHIITEAVMLLDLDVEVSCDDLAFTHNVWRSGSNSFVGYFPRLHWRASTLNTPDRKQLKKANTDAYIFGGPLSVYWRNAYSLMLPAGVMIHKKYLWKIISSATASPATDGSTSTTATKNRIIQTILSSTHASRCTPLAFPLIANHIDGADPPIWVAVPARIHVLKEKGYAKRAEVALPLSGTQAESCLRFIYDLLSPINATTGHGSWLPAMMQRLNYESCLRSLFSSFSLSHIDAKSNLPKMVDVSDKDVSKRHACAQALVLLPQNLFEQLFPSTGLHDKATDISTSKGPVFATAVVSGVMAAKRTSFLIPFCHQISLDKCDIDISIERSLTAIKVECRVCATHKTGVEMEALVGASSSALCVYDMLKALSHHITISDVKLMSKTGGKYHFSTQPEQ